jgi:hypothetical protein
MLVPRPTVVICATSENLFAGLGRSPENVRWSNQADPDPVAESAKRAVSNPDSLTDVAVMLFMRDQWGPKLPPESL